MSDEISNEEKLAMAKCLLSEYHSALEKGQKPAVAAQHFASMLGDIFDAPVVQEQEFDNTEELGLHYPCD